MELMDVILQRRSVRRYEPTPVPDELLEELLEGVIREEYPNEKQTLLAQAKKFSAS